MKVTKNTWIKGLSKGVAKSKTNQQTLDDATDIKIFGETNSSNFVISNIKGNRILYNFPILPNGTPVFMGSTFVEKYLIIFSTIVGQNDDQIWKLEYDIATHTILGLSGNDLVPATHLIYQDNLKLNTANPVEAIARFENQYVTHVYFWDALNQLRTINITNPNLSTLAPETFDLVPGFNLEEFEYVTLKSGNLPVGRNQYTYRLISKDGAFTKYAPLCQPIQLLDKSIFGNYWELEGGLYLDSSESSIEVKLSNIDTRYDYIQVVCVQHEVVGLPKIIQFPMEPIGGTDFTFLHSGDEKGIFEITPQEFADLSSNLNAPKTATVKNNKLFIANTKEFNLEVNYDTRAYRFKNTGGVIRGHETSTGLTITSLNWGSIPKTDDVINPYNQEDPTLNPDWAFNDQYKYQTNGTTLGGEGLNIKYSFVATELGGDDIKTPPTEAFTNPFLPSPSTATMKEVKHSKDYGAPFVEVAADSFGAPSDFKNPKNAYTFVGYANGEVYRFGVEFYDKNGRKSFVSWIGDIKFPMYNDLGYEISRFDGASQNLKVRSVGIKFELKNLNNLPENVKYFKIVRVQREVEDRTRMGTGITGGYEAPNVFNYNPTQMKEIVNNFVYNSLTVSANVASGAPIVGALLSNVNSDIADRISEIVAELYQVLVDKKRVPTLEEFQSMIEGAISTALDEGPKGLSGLFGGAAWPFKNFLEGKVKDLFTNTVVPLLYELVLEFLDVGTAGIKGTVHSLGGTINNKKIGYIISPTTQFDKEYTFRQKDYIRYFGEFTEDNHRYTQIYHNDNVTGVSSITNSSAVLRKWYNPAWSEYKTTIKKQAVIDNGEIIYPSFSEELRVSPGDQVYANAFIGVNFQQMTHSIVNFTGRWASLQTLGIGGKKQFVVLENSAPNPTPTNAYIFKDYNRPPIVAFDDPLLMFSPVNTLMVRTIDRSGDFFVSYERYLTDQYGGNSYVKRSLNTYIPCGNLVEIDANTKESIVYGGDVFTGVYDSVNYAYYFEQVPGYKGPKWCKKSLGEIFPCQAPMNFLVRHDRHFAADQGVEDLRELRRNDRRSRRAVRRLGRRERRNERRGNRTAGEQIGETQENLYDTRFIFDDFSYNDIYDKLTPVEVNVPIPLVHRPEMEKPFAIYVSEPKVNTEILDSWRIFKPANFIEVNGNSGPITKLMLFRNTLLCYQERGMSVISSEERAASVLTNETDLLVGTGRVLERVDYINEKIGLQHRFGIIQSGGSIYHIDSINKKVFRFSEGLEPISDTKDLTAFFRENLSSIETSDDIFNGVGITAGYDIDYNSIVFTVLGNTGSKGDYSIVFDENLDVFVSFRSSLPTHYMTPFNKMITRNPLNSGANSYIEGLGNYGVFYGQAPAPTYFKFIVNEDADWTKVFDNLQMHLEVIDGGVNIEEPLNAIRVSSDYLDSGVIPLVNRANIRRRERNWFLNVPRGQKDAGRFNTPNPRIVDKYMFVEFWYNNSFNRELKVHDILTYYRLSQP